jgi:uncharacterized protein (UPF0548 family)
MDNSDVLQLVRGYVIAKAQEAHDTATEVQIDPNSNVGMNIHSFSRGARFMDNGLHVLVNFLRRIVARPYTLLATRIGQLSKFHRDNYPN